jgi:hypothetical protein
LTGVERIGDKNLRSEDANCFHGHPLLVRPERLTPQYLAAARRSSGGSFRMFRIFADFQAEAILVSVAESIRDDLNGSIHFWIEKGATIGSV